MLEIERLVALEMVRLEAEKKCLARSEQEESEQEKIRYVCLIYLFLLQ